MTDNPEPAPQDASGERPPADPPERVTLTRMVGDWWRTYEHGSGGVEYVRADLVPQPGTIKPRDYAMNPEVVTLPTEPDLDVIQKAYIWALGSDGHVYGCVAGDMGFEPTGIQIDPDHLAAYDDEKRSVPDAGLEQGGTPAPADAREHARALLADWLGPQNVGLPIMAWVDATEAMREHLPEGVRAQALCRALRAALSALAAYREAGRGGDERGR